MLCKVDIEVYLKSLAISPTDDMSISWNLLWYYAIAAHKNRRVSPVWVDSSWSRCVINSILFIAGHDILISLHVQPCRAQTRTNGIPGFTDRWRTYWTPHPHSPRHFFANDTEIWHFWTFVSLGQYQASFSLLGESLPQSHWLEFLEYFAILPLNLCQVIRRKICKHIKL